MVFSATSFGIMAFCAKIASRNLSGPEVAFMRMAAGILPVVFVPHYRRAALHFHRIDLILYRGFFGGLAVMLYFIAIQHTTAGLGTLLNYTSPIWSGIFSLLFISEKISPRVLIPLPIAFTGIYLVVHASAAGMSVWLLLGLLSAVASGAAVTAMRAARREENSWSVYASFCFLGMLVNLPLTIKEWRTPVGSDWIALGACAVFAMAAQLLMTFSLRWVDAMTVGVISQLAVIVSMALGALFLHETITGLGAAGSVLTIAGVLGVTFITTIGKHQVAAGEIVPEA